MKKGSKGKENSSINKDNSPMNRKKSSVIEQNETDNTLSERKKHLKPSSASPLLNEDFSISQVNKTAEIPSLPFSPMRYEVPSSSTLLVAPAPATADPISLLVRKVQKEAFLIEYVKTRQESLLPEVSNYQEVKYDLQLNVSEWLPILDEDLIQYCCSMPPSSSSSENAMGRMKMISLVLKDITDISIAQCELLGNLLGPRIVELVIDNCSMMKWGTEMKALMTRIPNLQSMRWKKIPWLDDVILESLIKRYKHSLNMLEFERCHRITNNGLFQIGKYSTNIGNLFITCCNKITDVGLMEISKKNHILNIELSHCLGLGDKGIEALLMNSAPSLYSFSIINCANVTNHAVSFLYEISASWGKRRNSSASTIQRFVVRDNPNFTEEALLWVTASARDLVEVDLRDCPNIEYGKAILELASLTQIKYLRLGCLQDSSSSSAGKKAFRSDYFLQGIIKLIPNLTTLQIINLPQLRDDQIAEIFDHAYAISDLSLVKLTDLGTASVESICSNLPNLSRLEIAYSNNIRDIDLRCITSVCLHLKAITVSHCPQLTDAGFTRFVALRYLEECHIHYLSKVHLTSLIVKFLSLSPVKKVSLHGVRHENASVIGGASGVNLKFLKNQCRQGMREISLKESLQVTQEDIQFLLNHFVFLERLDLTNLFHLSPDILKNLQHFNPFLELRVDPDFVGFALTSEGQLVYRRYLAMFRQLTRHIAAKKIQKLRRSYLKRLEELKVIRKENWLVVKEICIIRIQKVFRGYRVRKEIERQRKAVGVITRYVIKFFMRKGSLKLYRAKTFYREYMYRKYFRRLLRHQLSSKSLLEQKFQQLKRKHEDLVTRKYFALCKVMQKELTELAFEQSAMIIYYLKYLKKILFYWRKVTSSGELQSQNTLFIKQRLVKTFLAVVPLSHYNSIRQERLIALALAFEKKRILTIAWIELAKDRLAKRRIDKMIPMAIEYARRKFFQRVVGKCYGGLTAYYKKRLQSKKRKLLGEQHYERRLYRLSVGVIYKYYCIRKFMKIAWMKTKSTRARYLLHKALTERFHFHTLNGILAKDGQTKAAASNRNHLFTHGYMTYKLGILRDRKWREMNKIAELTAVKLYNRKSFKSLVIFKTYNRNIDAYYYRKYLLKLCRKILLALQFNVAMERDRTNLLVVQLKRKTRNQEHFLRLMHFIQRFQAVVRGRIKKRKFAEERIEKLFAIQTLQNFFRVVKARKEYMSRLRKEDIAEKVREDTELDLMRDEEAETRYYLYKINAIVTIQRCFRGHQGRKIALIVAYEMRKFRGKQEYIANQHLREHHEAFLRAQYAKEKIRANAAIEIQRVWRGRMGRKIFADLQYQKLISKTAVSVQHAYQVRLAQLQLKAIKRDSLTQMRHLAARRQRGMVLRLFGLAKRKYQNMIAPMLESLGIDPISFNYRISELVTETVQDFEMLLGIYHRERDLFKKHGINRLNRLFERRQILAEQGFKYKLHDAVRIIEPGHAYYGLTGVIVRIDETLVGYPLYEIRLDRYFGRQTFLRMTTDPLLTYEQIQPLTKVQTDPITSGLHEHQYPAKFGLDPTNEFYSKKNVYAAWTIQRAFRMHRSRRIVARVRYEHWRKNINRHHSLLLHLSESNALTSEGYRIAGILQTQSRKPIKFNELKQKLYPLRYTSNVRKLNELNVINKEMDMRFRDRMTFLQKSTILGNLKENFSLGFRKMTTLTKFQSLLRVTFGLIRKGGSSLRDLFGARSLKYLANQKSMVIGLDKYTFSQFHNSRHVRYHKASVYQGEWSGIPLFTPLRPHGEGMIFFLDGWGFAREDKVLYLTIVRCKYLNAVELTSSDPYCDIYCNGHNLQTAVKWRELNPEYHESFEIDVTNPQAELTIQVKSHDLFWSIFLGQIVVKMSDLADGKEHHLIQLLKGENPKIHEDFDRGEIEIRLKWAERVFEDDQIKLEVKKAMLIRLQSWFRRISALVKLKELRKERERNLAFIRRCAIKITSTCRIRLARKEYKRRSRKFKAATKIQKRVRIWIARRVFRLRKLHYNKARKIQTAARVWLARRFIARIKQEIADSFDRNITLLQKNVRRYLALKWYGAKKKEIERFRRKYLLKQQQQAQLLKRNSINANAKTHALDDDEDDDETEEGDEDPAVAVAASAVKNEEEKEDDDIIATIGAILGIKETIEQDENNIRFINSMNEQVEDWIGTYGKDAEYGLKRNRRITERLFQKILRMRLARIISRFGIVYIDSYPPRKSEEELLQEMNNSNAPSSSPTEPLTNRDDFVSVYFPMFQPVAVRKAKAMELFHRFPHTAILHLPTSIDMRASVNYNITTIQCFIRQRKAKQEYNNMMKVHKAIALFQRIFRRRYERFHKASILIVSLFRMRLSKVRVRFLKREKDAAMTIQNSYRCYLARSLAFDLRSVSELSVLKSSPDSAEYHGPERVLEHRSDTFWMANTIEKAEIRIEFLRPENVIEVWIMTSTFSASPTHVTISVLTDKKEGYNELFEKVELPLLKGDRWHKFKISTVLIAKYFMVTFYGNYGDSDHISVRQVRFLKSKEKSVEIIKQPSHYILDAGPMVGTEGQLELFVLADSWPKPTYQWYRNGMLVEGATDAKLVLSLFCEPVGSRTYRCIRCKMSSKKTPYNAYHIQCGNCAYLFTYKDVEDFDAKIAEIRSKENDLHSRKTGILTSKVQMESFQNAKYKALVKDLNEQLHQIEQALQLLREERYFLKQRSEIVNDYPNEGIYTCVVQNIRGGSIKMKKTTIGAVVLVERPTPYIVDVIPYYQPRPQTARKKWSIYTSLVGTFIKGRLDGLVLIRYHDGSYYEGPYVPEDCINEHGLCYPERKLPHHYGRYYLADGRIFEGFNVDNHFDPYNLQLFYRLTLPNGETYEGNFCDETYHGIGLYTYLDGSVYEGRWHRGTRFGHGQLRSSEGWTYEGFFDKDRRHRQGVISFPDGSCYMGDFYYDSIQGKGIYITHLRDVYKGEMKDGKYHGHGEMLYSDGSTYVGEFQNGLRHGRGVFMEREGSEYYGHWKEDLKIGEHIVKIVIPIEEKGQDNYEIRIGIYDDNTGELVKWKSRFSNPIATKQFIHLFKQNRDMFDSVYSMILAKHLPNLPEGIDANNKIVKNIIFKIRTEAGMLVGQQALIKAKQQLDELMIPLQDQTNLVNNLKTQIENLSLQMIAFEKEANDHYYKFLNLISKYEKDTAKIEQLWLDEPKQTRKNFYIACKKLYNISVDEYFAFRNHRVIPVFVKKILDAISYLLGIPNDWKEQQMIISDAVANGRNGDEEALRLDYHCKLAYLMKDYEVYKYLKIEKLEELRSILADVRFRSDSFYIEATGPPGPVLVEWAKANYAYISSANDKFRILSGAEEKKLSAYRFKAAYNKKKEEMEDLTRRIEETRHQLQQAQLELEDIQHAVLRANDLLQFITGRFNEGNVEGRQDYYKILEKKLEEKKDFFTIEVCMQSMCDRVIERYDKEQNKLRLQAYSMGVEYHEPIIPQGDLVQWIREEVLAQQEAILEKGRTLGYSLINERLPTDITLDYMTQVISLVVDIIIGKMNDHFNDLASSRSWISMKGRKFNSRFIYIYTWKVWEEEGLRKRDQEGINAWERIFVDVETCTIMAIEARVNNRMSALARAQGITWGLYHPTEIAQMEEVLAKQFEEAYMNDPSLIVDGAVAIEMDTLEENPANQNPDYPPRLRAQCQCWIKLHPNEVTKQKDSIALQFAQEFEDTFPKETGLTCFRILNNIAADDEMIFYQQAVHWKEFHIDEYEVSLKQLLTEMSKDFIEAFPLNSYYESAKYIEKYYMSQYLFDQQETYHAQYLSNPTTTLAQEFVDEYTMNSKMLVNAYAYRMLNQGMYSKGLTMFMTECQANFLKQWNDLLLQTDQWQKGNAMMFGSDEAGNDRFYGFRVRLYTKFVFLIIFLYRQKDCIIEKLSVLAMKDPIYKIKHRVRPSQLQQVSEEVEMNYLTEKLNLETQLQDVMVKISMWNTYFGIVSESDYYPQHQGVNESSMIEEQRSHIE